jgi:hypothetical protein
MLKVTTHWNDIDDFIEKQSKISTLMIYGSNVGQTYHRLRLDKFVAFDVLERKKLCLSNEKFAALIKAHPELKSVSVVNRCKCFGKEEIKHVSFGAEVIKALCHLPELEKLVLKFDKVYDDAKDLLSKLKMCAAKEVEVDNSQISNQSAIKEILKMKNIQKFTAHKLLLNPEQHLSSTLKDLFVSHGSCNLNRTLFSFDRLLRLNWNMGSSYEYNDENRLIYNDENVAYPHLVSLKADHKIFQGNFVNFLKAVPKLKLLHLQANDIPFSNESLEKLLTMPNLRNITLTFTVPAPNQTDEAAIGDSIDLELLKDLCKKLKKFAIKFIGDYLHLTDSLKAEFSKMYSLVHENYYHASGYILKSR